MRTPRRTTIGLGLVLCALATHAQFDALPDSDATWAVSFWVGPGYPHEGEYYFYDELSPDTLLAGLDFKKLRASYSSGGYVYEGSNYAGALRDNGLGQVFFVEPGSDEPWLLYDFDVLPGDTVSDVYSLWMEDVIVFEVDTIVLNGRPRKRIGLACLTSPDWSAYHWIQGIGGVGGLFYTNTCGSVSGSGVLVCMSENDTIQYGGSEGSPGMCDLYLGTDEAITPTTITVAPNPSSGSFAIAAGKEAVLGCTVFDAYGAIVLDTPGSSVDLSRRVPGVYGLVARTGKGTFRTLLLLE